MKIAYVANVRMPTERAHGVQIAKTCEAFVRTGVEVELVVPRRRTHIADTVSKYYGLKDGFKITKLFTLDIVSWGATGFLIESFLFACSTVFSRSVRAADVVYGRDEFILLFLSWSGVRRVAWESHTGAWSWAARSLAARAEKLVVISNGLRNFYIERGVPSEKILVAHDAIDPDDFAHPETREVARARLGLSQSGKIVMYIGSLGGWKGVDTLLEASTLLQSSVGVVIVGGTAQEISKLRALYPRVQFLGSLPYRDLANNQIAADVLVLPNTGRDVRAAQFTSPLKLFAYMMSGRPIVASDLPSTREVLPENGAYWFVADNARSCASAIEEALGNDDADQRTKVAQEAAMSHTWDVRARRVVAALS
jgi:glycosyltransferase involved in cell wall biosynthesis